ncbi:MAG: MerR family transcriptional regulator [Burkholderiaceae bacterium]
MLPTIPAKRYFTIGEVAELCEVKPHVLRYWEQEFTQLRPIKRRGNRRYYQHHEVLMIRRIRDLLYGQGFTINGARNRLQESAEEQRARLPRSVAGTDAALLESELPAAQLNPLEPLPVASDDQPTLQTAADAPSTAPLPYGSRAVDYTALRNELLQLRALLCNAPATETRVDRS